MKPTLLLLALACVLGMNPGTPPGWRGPVHILVMALLTTKEIFTLWYLIAMTVGITVVFGFSRLKAGLLATTAWIASVLFNTFLLQSVINSLHLRV